MPAPPAQEIILWSRPAVPPPVAWWAIPGRTAAYRGGYVGGGGSLFHSEPRNTNEGTWGWDYQGLFCLRKLFLPWNHGRLYQGGEGAYRTQGKPVYNILAFPPLPEKKTASEH